MLASGLHYLKSASWVNIVAGREEVADMVFVSISEQELYILPHYDSTITAVEGRAETILARAVPALQGIAALQAARKAAGKDEAQVNDEAKARL